MGGRAQTAMERRRPPFQLRVRMVSPCRVRDFLRSFPVPGLNVVLGDSVWWGGSPAPRTRACPCLLSSPRAQRAEGSALTDCDSASSAHVCCSAPSSAEEAGLGSHPNKLPSLPPSSALKIFIGMVIKLFIAEALINITSLDPFLRSIHFALAQRTLLLNFFEIIHKNIIYELYNINIVYNKLIKSNTCNIFLYWSITSCKLYYRYISYIIHHIFWSCNLIKLK